VPELQAITRAARREIVKAVAQAGGGHLGGPLSAVETLTALYFRVLRIRPDQPDWPDRDRFILSKGHSAIGLYAVLALRGYFGVDELGTFDAIDSRLQGHPDMTVLPGLDMSTGSLGLGLAAGVGMAVGAKLAGAEFTTFVMVGDGECNEGVVWESAHVADRYGLDNLVVIVDHNGLQQFGWRDGTDGQRRPPYRPGQLRDRWSAFGWQVLEADGHDLAAMIDVLNAARRTRGVPAVVLAETVKGKGVSFMEGDYRWHSRVPSDEELRQALSELAEPNVPDSADHASGHAAAAGRAHRSREDRSAGAAPMDKDAGQRTAGQRTAGQHTAGQHTAGQHTAGQHTAGQHTAGQHVGLGAVRAATTGHGPGIALRQVFGETMAELAGKDPRILVLDGDVGSSTGAGIFEAAHPGRYLQTGIAEQNMLAMAAGLATVGYRPYVSTFSCFAVARALDPVRVLISQPKLNVKIMGGYAGLLTGMTGKTHQMLDDLAIMRTLPNMLVLAPADETEARQAIHAIAGVADPAYMQITREPSPVLFGPDYRFRLGRAVVISEGTDVTLISTGVQTTRVVAAAEILGRRGIAAGVLHLPTVKPLDEAAIVAAAQASGHVITIEEQSIIGGLGGAVAEVLSERYPVPVHRLGIRDRYGESGPNEALLDKYRLSASRVAEDVEALLSQRSRAARPGRRALPLRP
jgi:transketolase